MTEKTAEVLLAEIDTNLTTLQHAAAVQRVAASVGFDWPDIDGIVAKIHEELAEVEVELPLPDNMARITDEIGDLLYVCTSLARRLNIDPDATLQAANEKFQRRFIAMDTCLQQQGILMKTATLAQMDACWDIVKQQEKSL